MDTIAAHKRARREGCTWRVQRGQRNNTRRPVVPFHLSLPIELFRFQNPFQTRRLWRSLCLPAKIVATEDNLTGGHR